MLSEKSIARITTDFDLGSLYESLLRSVSQIIVDKIQTRFNASPDRATFAQKKEHLNDFRQKRDQLLFHCRLKRIKTPKSLSLRELERFLLRHLMP